MSTDIRFENGELIVTRVYAASREAVFEAWVETSKVEQWWGCGDTTRVRSHIEPRVGGRYDHTMTIAGSDIAGNGLIVEFVPPSRLAYTAPLYGTTDIQMRVTVDFTEVTGGTRVQLVHQGIPDMRVDGDVELRLIVRDGWTAAFGKLDTFLVGEMQATVS
ncbi:MAG: SRPBCC domain-containing protein [Acidobacteriota bacterium]